ncbi:MAG: hypothetical protein ACOYM3_26765 [Terrimicrobiaceae bacterium]
MKTRTLLLLASALVIGHSNLFAEAKYSKFTADYYKGAYDLYEGQEITLKVAFVKPYSYKSDISDVRFFHAITRDDQKNMSGGEIPVAVPISSGNELIRRYGTAGSEEEKTRLLRGVLRADGHGLWFVDVNGTLTKTLDARRQTEMKSPQASPSPAASASPGASPEATPAAEKPESTNGAEPMKPWWKVW